MKLTPKQARFVEEYLVDLNAAKAATRAGYSPKTAKQTGYELLQRPDIGAAIQAAKVNRSERTQITADRVLQELARLAFFDIRRLYHADGNLKQPHEMDEETAAAVAQLETFEEFEGRGEDRELVGLTKKAKVFDKGAALGLAMRHLGMFNDKLRIERPRVRVRDLTGRKKEGGGA